MSQQQQSEQIQIKPQDLMVCRALLAQLSMLNAQAAMHAVTLRQFGVNAYATVYYPGSGNKVYIGIALELPSEQAAKYFMECVRKAQGETVSSK